MKLNKKNRWSSLLALVAAGIVIQASPAVFAAYDDATIWNDLSTVTNGAVTQAKLLSKTPPPLTTITDAVLSVIANHGAADISGVDTNLYANQVVNLVLSNVGKAVKVDAQPVLISALTAIENNGHSGQNGQGAALVSGSIQDLLKVGVAKYAKIDLITVATTVAKDFYVQKNGNLPELAGAASTILAAAKTKNTIALAAAFSTVTDQDLSDSHVIDYAAIAGKIAAPLAPGDVKKNKTGIAVALTTGHAGLAADIADAVARTTGGNSVSESAIVAAVIGVAGVNGTAVRVKVETTSLGESYSGPLAAPADFNTRAVAYANVAANFAANVSGQAAAAVTQAAQAAVDSIHNDLTLAVNGNGNTGKDYYQIATAFGNVLAKKTSAKTSPGTLSFGNASVMATAIGQDIQDSFVTGNGDAATKGTIAYNLTEVFGAVAVGLTHTLTVKKNIGDVINVMEALINIQPVSAPDMLGLVLTDMSARGLTYKSAAPLYATLAAYVTAHASGTTLGKFNDVWTNTFVDTTPSGKKRTYAFQPRAGYDYAVGTLTGAETPVHNG